MGIRANWIVALSALVIFSISYAPSFCAAAPPTSTQSTPAESQALADEIKRKARERDLKGAGDFLLLVSMNGSAESLGLKKEGLETKVELELRRAGIPFNPPKLKEVRFLNVELSTVGGEENGIIAFAVTVSLHEEVLTIRKGVTSATTWESSTFGTIGTARVNELYATVIDHVQKFANAFLISNPPRPAPSADGDNLEQRPTKK